MMTAGIVHRCAVGLKIHRKHVDGLQATPIFRSRLSHGVRPGPQRCSLPLRWYFTRSVLGTRYLQLTLVMRRGGWRMSLTLPGLLDVLRESIARDVEMLIFSMIFREVGGEVA